MYYDYWERKSNCIFVLLEKHVLKYILQCMQWMRFIGNDKVDRVTFAYIIALFWFADGYIAMSLHIF